MRHFEPAHDLTHSNLPASFDVTPLLTKLEHFEGCNPTKGNPIQTVKLIELDPYYHYHKQSTPSRQESPSQRQQQQQQQQRTHRDKTRLFLAVACGKKTAVAQLIALELGLVVSDENDVEVGTGGDGTSNVENDELEWIDVSDDRVLLDGMRAADPVVIFPPSFTESLSSVCAKTQESDYDISNNTGATNDFFFASDITACALIPAPVVHIVSKAPITQRIVALMLGNSHDQVFSLLLKVSESFAKPDTTSLDSDHVRFVLEYDACKIIEHGKLKEVGDVGGKEGDSYSRCPCVQQILPRAMRFGPNYGTDREDAIDIDAVNKERFKDSESFGCDHDDPNAHIQVFHPSLQSLPTHVEREEGDEQSMVAHSGIKSISFFLDKSKLSKCLTGLGETEGQEAMISQDIILVMYGNGTIVKLPSWRPFIAFHTGSISCDLLDDVVVDNANILRNDSSVVVPLINIFPSPLDVPPPHINHRICAVSPDDEINEPFIHAEEYWSLLSVAVSSEDALHRRLGGEQGAYPSVKALVLAGQSAPASMQSIAFNLSRVKCDPLSASAPVVDPSSAHGSPLKQEEQSHDDGKMSDHGLDMSSDDERYGPMTGTVVGGTAALMKGALGMALGAVRWGLGGGTGVGAKPEVFDDDDTPLDEFMEVDEGSAKHDIQFEGARTIDVRSQFINRVANDMLPWPLIGASFSFSDLPRRFETAVVDPSGSFVATTDNLGRVILFDLESNQPIRMIKGMRNVSCHFAELPCCNAHNNDARVSTRSYLVIHLRQRGSVEVFPLPQGPRVATIEVPHQKDCTVIECHGPPSEGGRVSSFLLERNMLDENDSVGCYFIDKIVINDNVGQAQAKQKPEKPMPPNESKMYLNIFMQLLAPDTNIQFNTQTVLATFRSIRSLTDLGEGLDVLSKCTRLEREMGIDCSSLLSQAISYCKLRLRQAQELEAQEGSGSVRKAAILELSSVIAYSDRLVHAYDVLHRYETRIGLDSDGMEDNRDNMVALSPWASEALSWISAASRNDALKNRYMPTFVDVRNQGDDKPLEFAMFATVCQSNGNDRVYLTKVKRDHLFVFKVVHSMFGSLGLDEDFDVQQQYFGEWVSTLSTEVIAKTNMSGTWRPMIRWLQDLIISAHDTNQQGNHGVLRKTVMLDSLMKFCMEMEDLPKAFLLSVICMDAVSSASTQLEHKTYGKITKLETVRPWEDLLRKLRVCLLVSLRLSGNVNPIGEYSPMTVSSVSRPDIFSAFSWIAVDELTLSHDNQVIMALESACLSSSQAFYPSSVEGDSEQHKKTILQSCIISSHGRSPINPTGLTDDTHSRALLFYLKDHAHFTTQLAANRALILARVWGQSPQNLPLLSNAITALQTAVRRFEGFGLAALIEVYQSVIRPVCRAMLFGFDDHELSEIKFLPLMEDQVWLTEFISAVRQMFSMMIECMLEVPTAKANNTPAPESSEMWPPIRECKILNDLVKKLRYVHQSSVELHHTVIFAFEMTRNVHSLASFVPSFARLFLIGSLFSEMPQMPRGSDEQQGLLDKAIIDHAAKSSTPVLDNFSCINSVELFGKSLGLGAKYVRTRYLIEMIRLGKDASINDLLGGVHSSLDGSLFAENVIQILCGRLHATIQSLKQTKRYRGIHSLLDADASRWLREEAATSSNYTTTSLITTHSLVMRLQSMSLDNSSTEKIEALSVMSGTLLKAVQAHEQDALINL